MTPTYPADVLGFSRLVIDATAGMAGVVEAMHQTIAGSALGGMVGAAYAPVRAIAKLIGRGMDAVLTPLIELAGETQPLPEREAVLAAVNGILGDHLAATENPLAIPMRLRRSGRALRLKRRDLQAAIVQPNGKVLVLVHGLCMNDLQWTRRGRDRGAALAGEPSWGVAEVRGGESLIHPRFGIRHSAPRSAWKAGLPVILCIR